MVGSLLVGFVCLNLQFSVSWLVDFQWGSHGSIFSFLRHGWQTFSGVRMAQSLVFCVKVGKFQWGSCGSNFIFLSHGCQTFSGVRVAQSLVFCVIDRILLVGFVWLNLQFSASWLGDFQWGSCGSNFNYLWHGWQTFSGVREAQSLVFWVKVGDFQWGSCGSIFTFLSHGWQSSLLVGSCGSIFRFLCHDWWTFSWVRVAQSFVFCVIVGRLLVRFVWLNLQFFVSWLVDFQWASCGSIFSFLCHCRQTFSGVRVAQSLVFFDMVGRPLVGFVWLNLQSSVSWLVDFQWGSCGSIYSFLCHGWQAFSGVRVAQTLVFCFMVGRLLVGFVRLNLQFSVSRLATCSGVRVAQSLVFCLMVGRLLVGFVCLNLQFSASWLVDFQWGSCGSIFNILRHGSHTVSGVRVSQSLVFCIMVGRHLGGFVWLKLQFSVSWQVDFQWGSCGSIFRFLRHGWQTFSGVREAQSLLFCLMVCRLLVGACGSIFRFLCHDWWTFSGLRVSQSFVFCVMVGRLLVGFVWLYLQFSVSWLVDFQWASCVSIFRFLCHDWWTFSWLRVSHDWWTFSGLRVSNLLFSVSWLVDFQWVRVAQYLDFCVMIGGLLVGFVCLNLLFSVSWLVDFQWGSCGSIFRFLCHVRQTFSGVRVSQSLVFCVMVGRLLVGFVRLNLQFSVMVDRLLVGFVWFNLQFSVSWQVDFQWGSCGSIFSFLCHGWQTFSGVRVAETSVFCVMVGRLLVGFVWANLQFSASWLVDFQWGS